MTRTRNNILVTLGPQGPWVMLYTRFGLTLCWLEVGSQQNCDPWRDAVHSVPRGARWVNPMSAVWSICDAVHPSRMMIIRIVLYKNNFDVYRISQMQRILQSGCLNSRDASGQDHRLHASSSAYEWGLRLYRSTLFLIKNCNILISRPPKKGV
jgi:hypothetical protein